MGTQRIAWRESGEVDMTVRRHTCLRCRWEGDLPVEYSRHTANLSGEKQVWCPCCGGRSLWAEPQREVAEREGFKAEVC